MYPKNFCTSTLSPSDLEDFFSSTGLSKPVIWKRCDQSYITASFTKSNEKRSKWFEYVVPVNKPYDTAEKRPKTSPMIECFLVLRNNNRVNYQRWSMTYNKNLVYFFEKYKGSFTFRNYTFIFRRSEEEK